VILVPVTEIIRGLVERRPICDHRGMADTRSTRGDDVHDVLAAEEFAVPAPDPALHREEPHDVLAAEAFVVPAPDPAIRHGPVALPADPTGIAEPHDVLAAEEFAMPAGRGGAANVGIEGERRRSRVAAVLGVAAVAALLLRKRHR
jgi:hypothetical protein